MKISLEWLSEFIVWTEKDPATIADRLTLSSAEVEEIDVPGALLNHCCVGEVLDIKKHPEADRLVIVEVKTDKGTKTVVCGGTNVRQGMKVAFAHTGATVKWHGEELMTLEPVKIRGVQSEGMICAAEELGLEHIYQPHKDDGERPIIDLADLQTGKSLKEALKLNDATLHINNTAITTRPDLFSHLGFARECVALGLGTWKKKPAYKMPKAPSKKGTIQMSIDAKNLVPRYLACEIEISGMGETPEWMKNRLAAVGIRSVSLPVDITNYVMMETGMPMHSFDADDIKGSVNLRLSKKGESITTLDNQKRALPEGVLVLSDDAGIFDLVGIMGGLRSSTKASTKRVYLHAVVPDATVIRKAIIGTDHRTDAATVYEKSVPAITAEQGFIRAVELFIELVPGAKVVSAIDNRGTNGKPAAIDVTVDEINAALGTDIKEKEIMDILTSLEFTVKNKRGALSVMPPLHRMRDITGPHDIVEEVGRIHGFDGIQPMMPNAPLQLPARDERIHTLRDSLKESGYWEIIPLSFVSPALLRKCGMDPSKAVEIANPLGEETSLLQPGIMPGILAHAQKNIALAHGELRTFQSAHVFKKDKPESLKLGMLIAAKEETDLLNDPFLQLKQDLLHALKDMGYDVEVKKTKESPPMAHPGRSAEIILDGKSVGLLCELHPAIRSNFDLPHRAAIASIDLTSVLKVPAQIAMAKPVPHFPSITYDVTVTRTQQQAFGELLSKLTKASPLLEDVSVKDLYAGKPLKDGQYNLTLRFTYRSPERTLTEDEVKKEHEKVLAGISV